MKKLLVSVVCTVLIVTSSFAADANKVNSEVVSSFNVEFKGAKNVTWKSTESFVKASFVLNDQNIDAFYDHEGNMIGTASNITIDQLPVRAKRAFAKKYADYIVKEAIQFDGAEETAYFISAESQQQSLLLKVSSGGFVSVLKYEKK